MATLILTCGKQVETKIGAKFSDIFGKNFPTPGKCRIWLKAHKARGIRIVEDNYKTKSLRTTDHKTYLHECKFVRQYTYIAEMGINNAGIITHP